MSRRSQTPTLNATDTLFKVGQRIPSLGVVTGSYSWPGGFIQYEVGGSFYAERILKGCLYLAKAKEATLSSLEAHTERLLSGDFSQAEYANYLYFYSISLQNRFQFKRWDTTIVSRLIWAKTNLHSALQATGHLNPNGLIFMP